MAQERRGARLHIAKRRTRRSEPDTLDLAIGVTPPAGGVRLDKPNQGPPAPNGSYLSLDDFQPRSIAGRNRRESEDRHP